MELHMIRVWIYSTVDYKKKYKESDQYFHNIIIKILKCPLDSTCFWFNNDG